MSGVWPKAAPLPEGKRRFLRRRQRFELAAVRRRAAQDWLVGLWRSAQWFLRRSPT